MDSFLEIFSKFLFGPGHRDSARHTFHSEEERLRCAPSTSERLMFVSAPSLRIVQFYIMNSLVLALPSLLELLFAARSGSSTAERGGPQWAHRNFGSACGWGTAAWRARHVFGADSPGLPRWNGASFPCQDDSRQRRLSLWEPPQPLALPSSSGHDPRGAHAHVNCSSIQVLQDLELQEHLVRKASSPKYR